MSRRFRRFLFVGGSCPTDFTDIHRFSSSEGFSSDFTDESEGILAYRITHGISQNFGRWSMARALYMLLLFFVTQISQMTQIFLCVDYFVPQISQMTQIFLCVDYFVTQISQIYADFSLWRLFRHADFSLWDIFQFQGVSAPTGQVASAKIRE